MKYKCANCGRIFEKELIEYQKIPENMDFVTPPNISEEGVPKCPFCDHLHFFGFQEIADQVGEHRCDDCGCSGQLYLHSRCHPESPTWAVLDQETSELELICAECETPLAKFKVLRQVQ